VAQRNLFRVVRSAQPVFDAEAFDPSELAIVVRDDRMPQHQSLSGYQQVVRSDQLPDPFEIGSESAVAGIYGNFERKDFKGTKNKLKAGGEALRAFPKDPIAKFGGDDNACAHQFFADCRNTMGGPAPRIAHQIGHNVCVQ
jgi:hypothetical protein